FSSRRRHTRFSRDWSSDVCSSDLAKFGDFQIVMYGPNVKGLTNKAEMETYTSKAKAAGVAISVCKISIDRLGIDPGELHEYIQRSEERRVGKECRVAEGWQHLREE